LNCKQTHYCAIIGLALVISALLGAPTSALAQPSAASTLEKWRPTDGYYESPGKDFDSDCRKAYGVFTIELAEKSVSGFEWNCSVNRVTDTAPGAIKLNMTCYDINMPTSARDPDAGERPFIRNLPGDPRRIFEDVGERGREGVLAQLVQFRERDPRHFLPALSCDQPRRLGQFPQRALQQLQPVLAPEDLA